MTALTTPLNHMEISVSGLSLPIQAHQSGAPGLLSTPKLPGLYREDRMAT